MRFTSIYSSSLGRGTTLWATLNRSMSAQSGKTGVSASLSSSGNSEQTTFSKAS